MHVAATLIQAQAMTTRDEKFRRMAMRRDLGLRPSERTPPSKVEPSAPYLIAHACFSCRKSFKREAREDGHVCPDCAGQVHGMGRAFKAPASSDAEQWKKVQTLYAHGFRFGGYRRAEGFEPLPERLRDVEAFIRENPHHPNRVADVDESLLP